MAWSLTSGLTAALAARPYIPHQRVPTHSLRSQARKTQEVQLHRYLIRTRRMWGQALDSLSAPHEGPQVLSAAEGQARRPIVGTDGARAGDGQVFQLPWVDARIS